MKNSLYWYLWPRFKVGSVLQVIRYLFFFWLPGMSAGSMCRQDARSALPQAVPAIGTVLAACRMCTQTFKSDS